MPTFKDVMYQTINLSDVNFEIDVDKNGKSEVSNLTISGKPAEYTKRFGTSLCSLFGFGKSIYNLFDPCEVVGRILQRKELKQVRVTLLKQKLNPPIALAATSPEKMILKAHELEMVLKAHKPIGKLKYGDGIITSVHKPTISMNENIVNGDRFINSYIINMPIDGYGTPAAYLSMLRMVCENMMVFATRIFKSSIKLSEKNNSEDMVEQMIRFVESFNDEEGYMAGKQRLETAHISPASLDELYSVLKILDRKDMSYLHTNPKMIKSTEGNTILNSDQTKMLQKLGGSACDRYGLVSLYSLSTKKRQRIPTDTTMYNLINFVAELSTHSAQTAESRILDQWIGNKLAMEFDLEGTLKESERPIDLFFI